MEKLVRLIKETLSYSTVGPWGVRQGGKGVVAIDPKTQKPRGGMIVGMFPSVGNLHREDDAQHVANSNPKAFATLLLLANAVIDAEDKGSNLDPEIVAAAKDVRLAFLEGALEGYSWEKRWHAGEFDAFKEDAGKR